MGLFQLIAYGARDIYLTGSLFDYDSNRLENIKITDIKLDKILIIDNMIKTDRNCTICLENLTDNIIKLKCSHLYHKECIKNWIKKKPNCPMCRYDIEIE